MATRADIATGLGSENAQLAIESERANVLQPSASDKVADVITRGIRSGLFVPGQHLVEPDLTRRLGISRGSLREALKHLAADGIVTLNRFRGAYITSLDRKSVLDLLNVLEPLASLAAETAADKCDDDAKRQRITKAGVDISAAAQSRHRGLYLECRRAFYLTMVDIGENQELARVIPLSRSDLFRAQIETVQSDRQMRRHAAGYPAIARAVSSGQPAAARCAIRRHFEGTRKTIAELPDSAFPE